MTAGIFAACCWENYKSNIDKSLYKHGLEMIALMHEMAGNEAYRETFSVNEEIGTILSEIAAGDYSRPGEVCAVTFSDESLEKMVTSLGDAENLDGMSEELKESLKQKMFGAVISQLNGKSGAVNLAAASICTTSRTFVNRDAEENVIYFYEYEGTNPVAVTFIVGEDDAVEATATYVMGEEMQGLNFDPYEVFENMGAKIHVLAGG